jgi:hypothetical protein
MPTSDSSPEVQANLQKLASVASTINQLSDQLTEEVSEVEEAVNELNLGVTTNVRVDSWADEEGNSGLWRLAYGKNSGKWGFFVEYLSEWPGRGPDSETYESWLFKDSPRDVRLKCVEKIPLLLDTLVRKSTEVANTIAEKVAYAKDLATNTRRKRTKLIITSGHGDSKGQVSK